ncbi:hypothetical protein [Actinoplanes sp. NPDC051859]|uniref:hypothetical protein n=1 Tax=Actinoplanes sp. NPDC051859 TaxID=3363909 RepID=UPI0037991FF8
MGRHAADRSGSPPRHADLFTPAPGSAAERFARQRAGPRTGHPHTTIVRAIEDLAAAHREILIELFYQGVPLEAAAAARGLPVREVKSDLYFALRALRAVLDQRTDC